MKATVIYNLQLEFANQSGIARTNQTLEVVKQFNNAFQQFDASILKNLIAENCVMEGAMPPPNGNRVEGYQDNFTFWENMINTPDTQFNPEIIDVFGDKATIQWTFRWGKALENSIRGVTLILVRERKIVEALGYVKGNLS